MTKPVLVACVYCGATMDPLTEYVWRRTCGWERKARGSSRKSGSDIVLRQSREKFACDSCVQRLKRGIAPNQGALL